MKTLSLKEAADLLHMSPSSLREKAKQGIVPASKPGKCWVFIRKDLLNFLRLQQQEVKVAARRGLDAIRCHSIEEEKRGGYGSPRHRGSEYASRLGLPIAARHKNSTTH